MSLIAHEVRLKAMGTHYRNGAGGPELFAEETNSVLVGETGGVVQLSTAVVPGQLLLLANLESKREVVVQVKRRRAHTATSCYVELEFAEPAPRFWGMDFSAATALLPKHGKDVETAAMVMAAEPIAGDPGQLLAPASEEVQALREALREKPDSAAAPKSPSIPHDFDPVELMAAEQAILPKPSSTSAPSRPRRRLRARGNFTPGFRGGVLRLAVLTTALALTVIGAAWYKHWLPWKSAPDKSWMRVTAGGENAKTSMPPENRELPGQHPKSTNSTAAPHAPVISPGVSMQPLDSASSLSSSPSVVPPPAKRNSSAAMLTAKETIARPRPAPASQPIANPAAESVTVPPKLIKSVRAVVSLDDLRDFETGNVVIDAVVGTEGEVHFISVISGPPSLRPAAIGAVKQYRYEPATRNGRPVPEHVNITIRFHFVS
jgi:hypothetical protein